jgi:hypothetical protein
MKGADLSPFIDSISPYLRDLSDGHLILTKKSLSIINELILTSKGLELKLLNQRQRTKDLLKESAKNELIADINHQKTVKEKDSVI